VFLALIVGAFSLGQAATCVEDFSAALGAAGFLYDTIDRVNDYLCSITCAFAM